MLRKLVHAGLVWPTILAALGLAVLIGLGTWQMQRKAWKEGLIARLQERVRAAPVALERAYRLWAEGGDIEYLRVRVVGQFRHDREIHLYAPGPGGPGYHVYTPLESAAGVVLVNRGFVPEALKDRSRRAAGLPAGEVELVGLARGPAEQGWFMPDNDPVRNIWFWRDLPAMLGFASETADRPHTPFFIEAEALPANAGGWPRGGTTILDLPNTHFGYALTWYGLACALIGVYVAFARGRLAGADGAAG